MSGGSVTAKVCKARPWLAEVRIEGPQPITIYATPEQIDDLVAELQAVATEIRARRPNGRGKN